MHLMAWRRIWYVQNTGKHRILRCLVNVCNHEIAFIKDYLHQKNSEFLLVLIIFILVKDFLNEFHRLFLFSFFLSDLVFNFIHSKQAVLYLK
jgi:hypothetical protein